MTPQEAYEWIGVIVAAGVGIFLILFALAVSVAEAWDEWRNSR